MQVRDVMTWNVVTISGDMPIMEARKIMETHNIRRLPVVDKGKLVGMVSRDRIVRVGPSSATSLSIWEINYLLAKMTVKEVMSKNVTTVSPDLSVESAIALAQGKGVGALPVLEDHNLIGIITTNDFFYKLLNPVLGIGKPGIRLTISNCGEAKCIQDVMECIGNHKVEILSIHSMPPIEDKEPELCVHIGSTDASQIIKDLKDKGYSTELRER